MQSSRIAGVILVRLVSLVDTYLIFQEDHVHGYDVKLHPVFGFFPWNKIRRRQERHPVYRNPTPHPFFKPNLYICLELSMPLYVLVYVSVCVFTGMCLFICVYLTGCVSHCTCLSECIFVCASSCLYMSVVFVYLSF